MPLTAESISFSYTRGRPVLDSVSLALHPGEVTAIVGPNGAGKSTLLRLLLGLLRPSVGRVLLDGQGVASMSHTARARRIAYMPQRTSLAFAFTVREYVRLGRFAVALPPPSGTLDDDTAILAAMERADIADRADDPVPVLSAGQQQRAALARALAQIGAPVCPSAPPRPPSPSVAPSLRRFVAFSPPHPPRILLADEPVSAMDPRHALQTMAILRDLASSGMAIAVVLHDLTLAARFCDSAVVLNQSGKVAAAGPIAESLAPEVLGPVFAVDFLRMAAPDGLPILFPSTPAAHPR